MNSTSSKKKMGHKPTNASKKAIDYKQEPVVVSLNKAISKVTVDRSKSRSALEMTEQVSLFDKNRAQKSSSKKRLAKPQEVYFFRSSKQSQNNTGKNTGLNTPKLLKASRSTTSFGEKKKSKSSEGGFRAHARSSEKLGQHALNAEQSQLFDFSTTFKKSLDKLKESQGPSSNCQSPKAKSPANYLGRKTSQKKLRGVKSAKSSLSRQQAKLPVRLQAARDKQKNLEGFQPVLKEKQFQQSKLVKDLKLYERTLNS